MDCLLLLKVYSNQVCQNGHYMNGAKKLKRVELYYRTGLFSVFGFQGQGTHYQLFRNLLF